jgi:hypothetical protein
MDCRGNQKGAFMERKLRFLEKAEGEMLPFFLRDLGQIKKDVSILRGLIKINGETIPLVNDGMVQISLEVEPLQQVFRFFIEQPGFPRIRRIKEKRRESGFSQNKGIKLNKLQIQKRKACPKG